MGKELALKLSYTNLTRINRCPYLRYNRKRSIFCEPLEKELRKSSFSNLTVASPTSQLILQHFRRFTYVTAHSPTLLSLLLRHRFFTYVTWRAAHDSNVATNYWMTLVVIKVTTIKAPNFIINETREKGYVALRCLLEHFKYKYCLSWRYKCLLTREQKWM